MYGSAEYKQRTDKQEERMRQEAAYFSNPFSIFLDITSSTYVQYVQCTPECEGDSLGMFLTGV